MSRVASRRWEVCTRAWSTQYKEWRLTKLSWEAGQVVEVWERPKGRQDSQCIEEADVVTNLDEEAPGEEVSKASACERDKDNNDKDPSRKRKWPASEQDKDNNESVNSLMP